MSDDELRVTPYTDSQLAINTFALNHRNRLHYPDLGLLRDDETYRLLDHNCGDRYEPGDPLILDDAVRAHADRDSEAEVSFFTLETTEKVLENSRILALSGASDEFDALREDMRMLQGYFGESELRMVLLANDEGSRDRDGPKWVRVRRDTELRKYCGEIYHDVRIYDFPESHFYSEHGPPDAAWLSCLKQLLLRSTDRAYRHVRRNLELQHAEDHTEPRFRPRRQQGMERFLESKLRFMGLRQLPADEVCFVCTDKFDVVDGTQPVSLPCGEKHAPIHKACLIEWLQSTSPADATCAICRRKVFDNQQEIDDMKFGLVNGIYQYDSRFNAWENFERSCADLDEEHVENIQYQVTLDADLFWYVWDQVILKQGAVLELEHGETPDHLHPLCFDEWEIADSAVREAFSRESGTSQFVEGLFHRLVRCVYKAFAVKFRESGLHRYVTGTEDVQMYADPTCAAVLNIRPGFKELLERCLNRTLGLIGWRRCDCSPHFHSHGGRMYYNEDDSATWVRAQIDKAAREDGSDTEMTG